MIRDEIQRPSKGRHDRRYAFPLMLMAVLSTTIAIVLFGATGGAFADEVDGGATGYAAYTFAGAGGAYTGTMSLGSGFPAASFTSTSRAGSVGIVSGASTFLNTNTPPGAVFGSSVNRPYLNLRPAADQAASPSVTTYTFATPTPTSGWAFVLGDIDSDAVVVSATTATGVAATSADLGFAGVFNYCGGTPSPCTPTIPPSLPTWDPTTNTLNGNATATDTNGASGWFQPTVPLASLTFTYFRRSGLPIYQTWFAALRHDISGTVTGCPAAPSAPAAAVTVTLTDTLGAVIATTQTAADGTYAFRNYFAGTYNVSITAPVGCSAPPVSGVDARASNATADFALTADPAPPAAVTPTLAATGVAGSIVYFAWGGALLVAIGIALRVRGKASPSRIRRS